MLIIRSIIASLICLVFFTGCSFLGIGQTMEIKERDVPFAVKQNSSNEAKIRVGMSEKEVIDVWGEPHHVYKPDVKNEYNHFSDEFWIYTTGDLPNLGEKKTSYEVYFLDGKVIKIIELLWKGTYLGIG